jgi:hypothetical protein
MPALVKPFNLATVNLYLDKINKTHPELYSRIKNYTARYNKKSNITQMSLEVSYSNFDTKNMPNARGRSSESNIKAHIAGYWQLNNSWNLSLGGSIYDASQIEQSDGLIPHNTYLSYTNDYLQIDLGYKELWFSPFQESAMLLSTNAEPIARFSISSPTPLTDWKLQYGLSFGKLEEMEGIRFGDEVSPGRPGFLTMNLSTQPLDWWTLGFTRTMVFAGGARKVDLGDVWNAIIDPVNSDNCGGESDLQDCDEEFGNQQAAISSQFDVDWGMPVSIYMELAGEDTNNFKPYLLGNKAFNLGFFLPYLTEKSSALFEYQEIQQAWYTHHLYLEGYRNNLHSMGHWWGDEKLIGDGIGAKILTLRYNLELNSKNHLELKFASIKNANIGDEANADPSIYERGNELTIALEQVEKSNHMRYELYLGNDVWGEDFARLSASYRWR